ncbi:acyltransferase [Alteromonas sp. D210916BOD_24]
MLVMLPVTVLFFILKPLSNEDELLSAFSQGISLLPGKIGSYLRAGFYRFALTHCAPDALIGFGTLFSHCDTDIHRGVYIGPQSNIGKCAIGENTLLGSGVHVMSGKGQHNFDDDTMPIKDQGGTFAKVTIGANCWVGNAALIMANVGAGSVIAAGAVVVDDIPENAIAVGNPAKVVKYRR